MKKHNNLIFNENTYVPDKNKDLPFYAKHQGLIFSSIAIFLLVLNICNSPLFVPAFILLLIVSMYLISINFNFDKMKLDTVPVHITFNKDHLVLVRNRIYTSTTTSRKERCTFYYSDLKELKYNKDKKEFIINGNAQVEYYNYKNDKIKNKADLKYEAPCFFAMYPEDITHRNLKKQLIDICPFPIDFTNSESICSSLNK